MIKRFRVLARRLRKYSTHSSFAFLQVEGMGPRTRGYLTDLKVAAAATAHFSSTCPGPVESTQECGFDRFLRCSGKEIARSRLWALDADPTPAFSEGCPAGGTQLNLRRRAP